MKKTLGLILAVAFLVFNVSVVLTSAWAEQGSSPAKTAKDFAQAYFTLDASMGDYLSEEARENEDEVDMVQVYLETMAMEAQRMGYKTSYLRMHPIHIKTTVLEMDDSSARVQIDVLALRSINPLYRIVGYIFGMLEEHEFSDTVTLVKEDGEWKIAPGAFDLPV